VADRPEIRDPAGFVSLWGSEVDWAFATEPQAGLGGREIVLNQGRVLGGSTALNAMMFVRGHPLNYDHWNALGADGWSYRDVLPTFKGLEDYRGAPSELRGVGGPIPVVDCPDDVMRSDAFMRASAEVGFGAPYIDTNGTVPEGAAGYLQFHIAENGERASARTIFLDPHMARPNLVVRAGAQVARVLIEGGRAVGVAYREAGEMRLAHATREVVIAAGALQTPKLLMLSGIGPAEHLRGHALEVVVDSPGVGANLQDHLQLPVVFKRRSDAPNTTLLTGNVLFLRTREGSLAAAPDLQLNFTPSVPGPLVPSLNLPFAACIFLPILVQPFSRGWVTLGSADPFAPPRIEPAYLSVEADMQVFRHALKVIREIAAAPAFRELNEVEILPGPGADVDSFIRQNATSLWHPVGTARMGHDATAVVDPQLRVRGVEGLRVVDASVMPSVPSGNTVAPTFMIGWRAADLIKGSWAR
jgi:choline dehydrogenase